jgi:hypothetical protein
MLGKVRSIRKVVGKRKAREVLARCQGAKAGLMKGMKGRAIIIIIIITTKENA